MENIVKEMIEKARLYDSLSFIDESRVLLKFVRNLIDEMSGTYNCPSDWRCIGEEIATEYKNDKFVYEGLELWDYIN